MSVTYQDTLQYLYATTAVFEKEGASAYKPGLGNSYHLDRRLNHPHRAYKTIHVAGTNGKGSVCHTLAAIFQKSGYRTGLYTSPHLIDFCERIRVDGETIRKEFVVDFVEKYHYKDEIIRSLSFFEITTAMAFAYFREMKVDIAVIETGLGGRLDCTNIISPILSIITNISIDHTDLLGDSFEKIAAEKAGIIKPHTPVVIGSTGSKSVRNVFVKKAEQENAPIFFASKMPLINSIYRRRNVIFDCTFDIFSKDYGKIIPELQGVHQSQNARTILAALRVLNEMNLLQEENLSINPKAVAEAFADVTKITGLRGRWDEINHMDRIIIFDIAHNFAAWRHISDHVCNFLNDSRKFHLVLGFCRDKEIDEILELLPNYFTKYYFASAYSPRAIPADELARKAGAEGLKGKAYPTVAEALLDAIKHSVPEENILVAGSAYVVGEALQLINNLKGRT